MSSLLLFLFLFLTPSSPLEFRYHNNREIQQYLVEINASNSDISHLYSIGPSVRGQELWVLALGLSPHRHTVGIPEFKYVANMHGNEVLGRVLLLQLIDDFVRGYRNNEDWSVKLLNSTRIHILPTMNPDGFDESDTDCLFSQGRANYNGVDLNRNFPDAFAGLRKQPQLEESRREAEVRAVIGWLRMESFVLSANLHGGALVASYPYDNSNGGSELVGGASVSPDDDVFNHLAKVYSHNHASMHHGEQCRDSRPFLEGVTNGYLWYPISGVKGRVFDGSGVPVQNAVVEVKGRSNMCPFRTDKHGEYYRLLLPGEYVFTVTHPGHKVLTETLNVPHGPDQYSAMKHDFMLRQIPATTFSTQANPTSANTPKANPTSANTPKAIPTKANSTEANLTPSCNYTLNLEAGASRSSWTGLCVSLGLMVVLLSLVS
ncbi:Carboxypeptidase M [Dissostichus eleginoides]|uniref:Carboxypeptidase M n=1 Tax=Dissostichus eleginoides TaxID=100907 RepID=A0AAD9CTF5_DISEL|nr:Carboxypeptidase M [Dissostichus eleginoides]